MQRSGIGFLALTLFSAIALGGPTPQTGTSEIVGEGQASAAPDFVRLTVNVTSICYDSAIEARDANAVLANKVLDVLKHYQRESRDRVNATGGPSLPTTETTGYGENAKTLCVRKWRTENTLTLRTSAMAELGEIMDQVLRLLDSEQADPRLVKQTYAQLSQPGFGLYSETTARLQVAAQEKALANARAKFDAFASKCGFQNARLASLSTPIYGYIAQQQQQQAVPGGVGTPILPSNIIVQATWKFVWTFDQPNAICEIE